MTPTAIIISIVYLEPEWIETKRCIDKSGFPVYFVERNPKGWGSLAEAINRGFIEAKATDYTYAWIVTNVTFTPDTLPRLIQSMETGYDVIHPAFDSDHIHERPDGSGIVKPVPFVEFTSAIVRTDVFKDYPLDEDMPYWGHDPDHGLRMWQNGYRVGVDHGATIGHTYIRNNKAGHWITDKRRTERAINDEPTRKQLQSKYGKDWRWMFPRDQKAIDNYWKRLNIDPANL